MEMPSTGCARLMVATSCERPAQAASLREIEASDAVSDPRRGRHQTCSAHGPGLRQAVRQQPMEFAEKLHIPLWLDHSVREAVQDRNGPLFIATPAATRLDEIATEYFRAWRRTTSRGSASRWRTRWTRVRRALNLPEPVLTLAAEMAQALKNAKRPLVISGPSLGSEATHPGRGERGVGTARRLLAFTAPESNTFGLALMDAPALDRRPRSTRRTPSSFWKTISTGGSPPDVDEFLARFQHVVVLDHLETATTAKAELVLPAGTFAEGDGTLVSSEGRAQRFFQRFRAARADSGKLALAGTWETLDEIIAALAAALPATRRRHSRGALRRFPHGRREDSARAAPLQRAHRHARQYQRARAEAARRSRFAAVLFHGRKPGAAAPAVASRSSGRQAGTPSRR